jgi:prophage regulatory protein
MRPSVSSTVLPPDHSAAALPSVPDALQLPATGFLRQRQVLTFVPISKSTLWRRVQEQAFPAPVKLSSHVTAWRVEDVRRWIQEQGRPPSN